MDNTGVKLKTKTRQNAEHHLLGLTANTERKTAAAIAILVLVASGLYYARIPALPTAVNVATAVAGTLLIGLSFALGFLFKRFSPGNDPSEYRKMFGMTGFAIITIHVLLSLSYRSASAFAPGNELSIIAAALSFVIFAVSAASSSTLVAESIGYEKWLSIQRVGYIALLLAMVHFALIGKERFLASPLGLIVSIIVLVALVAKLIQIVRKK